MVKRYLFERNSILLALMISNCNDLEIKFEFNNIFYNCTGIYRSVSINKINFIKSLQSYLENVVNKTKCL